MAFDPEEFKQRRAQRQQQRQQRQAQQRRTVVKLIAAGVAVVLCAVLIFALTRKKPAGQPEQTTPKDTIQQDQSGDTVQTTPPTTPPTTVIHLAAAGDLNITEAVVNSGGSEFDYTNTFLDVAHLLADADITALNLEGNLFGAPYGTDRSAPQTMAQALADAGVDLVQLANSYSIYKGMDGLTATINGVRTAGMEPLGVYPNTREAKAGKGYTIRNVQGVKIAFVAFTKGMDSMALPAGSEGCVNLLYTDYATTYQNEDAEGITAVLDAVAKEKPDLTVAMLHWGSEYNDTVSESQNRICRLLQSKGVDAIIGTHSHYVQKMVYEKEAGTFVAYSLGDFLGDAQRAGSEYSVILDLEITKDNTSGETRITGYSYTPVFTVKEKDKPLRVVRIQETVAAYEGGYIDKVSQQTYEAMQYALTRIEDRITAE